ncbi:uncharacterized protein LOC128870216 [Anastrepha ludens]|uniref:uncharacterized protein LOC128870216 n=1 Tax=Anastrepha ludens TaxID=28586 RepID=UPI0023AFAE35|nr:uncharacterized protein LOC128870216 [Anastrepha ludens]
MTMSGTSDKNPTPSMNESDDERDLTSLTWLVELRNQNFTWPNVMHPVTLDNATKNSKSIDGATEEYGRQQELYDKGNSVKNKDNFNINKNTDSIGSHILSTISKKKVSNKSDGISVQDKLAKPNNSDAKNTRRQWNGKYIEKLSKKLSISTLQSQQSKLQMKRATPTERYEMFLEKVKR